MSPCSCRNITHQPAVFVVCIFALFWLDYSSGNGLNSVLLVFERVAIVLLGYFVHHVQESGGHVGFLNKSLNLASDFYRLIEITSKSRRFRLRE